jgi:hypothetical protein
MLPERELHRLTSESGVWLRNDDESSNELRRGRVGIVDENTVLRRVRGAMSYKFRTGLDLNKEMRGNP